MTSSIPTSARKIPATIVTGFLGSGKTTLIRHLLSTAKGKRLALIVNEFGDVGVDGDILRSCGIESCPDENIIELANGCLCCTVADDFIPTIEALLALPIPPDHIVIETSGLALPKPLVKAFNWPAIRNRVTVDGVVTVIDGAAVAAGRFADDPAALEAQRLADTSLDHDNPLEELYEDQLACADIVVLNKTDLLDAETLRSVRDGVARGLDPAVKIVPTAQGRIDAAVLLGLDAAAEGDVDSRFSHHDAEGEHDHDDFTSFVVAFDRPVELDALLDRLRSTIAAHDILRVKGFLAVAGRPMRLLLQGVGSQVQHHYDRLWSPAERGGAALGGRLVVIGRAGLDAVAITASLVA
ncbi:MAG TPA: cobalamin biosynthesis protein CobW [Stellaceae bacterium]|nr:cobalamin biosynthesis protein CobW [Stellaceae bacterium]